MKKFNYILSELLLITLLLCIWGWSPVMGQSSQDAAVELSAQVQADPPQITIQWRANAGATQHFVYRKLKTGNSWGAVLASFNGSATSFTDTTVQVGVSYEYRVLRQAGTYQGYGYINAGIEVPPVHARGKLILVVDSTHVDSLTPEIARLTSDLEGDGWQVIQYNVARDAGVKQIRDGIISIYDEDKPNTKAVFLLGRIPVPYSGDLFPDGHPDHEGAWPADVYYGEMNGTWTDNQVNVTVATDPRHHNTPEDGRWDQSLIPSDVELQVGRVDFANMPSFASSELQLLRNYLNKDHAYRHKAFTAVYRGIVDDNFGYFGGEAFAASGWKNMSTCVGADHVTAGDYFPALSDSSYLWSYGCGGGWYQGAGGVGSTGDFASSNLQSVFTMLFGSYFGDWDSNDNFLRAPLAQGMTLTNAWSGRPHWILHHMGLGETIGYGARVTQNNNALYFFSYGGRFVHIALMGDPTLRNDVAYPPSDVHVTKSGLNHVVTWNASQDTTARYYVYVKNDEDDRFVLLNEIPTSESSFLHACVGGNGLLTYMVRAEVLQTSASGTYFNLSQGVTDTITAKPIPEVHASASWAINGSAVAFTNLSLNADSYLWIFGDGATSTDVHPVHTYLDGFFNATLISSNGCTSDTFYFDINIFTGIKDIEEDPTVRLAPNPGEGHFVISWDDQEVVASQISVFSVNGQPVFEKRNVASGSELNLSSMSEGMYIMHITTKNKTSLKRLLIQR